MLLSAFNELKEEEYFRFQCICGQDQMTHWSRSPTTLRMVDFQLEDVFLVIFILNIDRKPNVVEFFILGPSIAKMALSRVARQRMVGSAMTTTTPESRTD